MAQQEWLIIIFACENKLFDKHILTEQLDPLLMQDILISVLLLFCFAHLINKGMSLSNK